MDHTASFWTTQTNKTIQCTLCPHRCIIPPHHHGICGVRENQNGTLITLIYQECSSIAVDPIEKKPLFHFHPATNVLSLGSIGCNLKCAHCQNYSISQSTPEQYPLTELSPKAAAKEAKMRNCAGIAFTYNEPTIWHEYTYDTAKQAKKQGLYTVYVTNGYINAEPLIQISDYLDAMNIDIKAFNEIFYKKTCKARLEPIKKTCELAHSLGIHIELTYLVIPNSNDDDQQIIYFLDWVKSKLDKNIPIHFTRFHPDYQMTNISSTPISTLKNIKKIAEKKGFNYVYLGNILHGTYENTYCPTCGTELITRNGFNTNIIALDKQRKCPKCSTRIPIIL